MSDPNLQQKLNAATGAGQKNVKKGDLWSNLGAAGYSGVNSLLMGLPDFLVEKVGGSKAYKALQNYKKENEVGSTVGDITGMVGSMFIPGGALVKGLGAGAKAIGAVGTGEKLANAGKFLSSAGGTTGQQIMRGVGTGLEQSAVRNTLDVSENEQGEKKSFTDRLLGTALGGAAGGLGGGIVAGIGKGIKKIGFQKDELAEALNKNVLANTGLESRAVNKWLNWQGAINPASKGKVAEGKITELGDFIKANGIKGKFEWEKVSKENDEAWDAIHAGFAKNAPKDWSVTWKAKATADLNNELVEMGIDPNNISKIMDKIGTQTNPDKIKKILSNTIRTRGNSPSPDDAELAITATKIKGNLDDTIGDLSGLGRDFVTKTKSDYKNLQPFWMQEGRDAALIPKLDAGSPTAEKIAGKDVLAKMMGAGGLGTMAGVGTYATSDKTDPDAISNALLAGAGGALIGKLGSKAIAGAANKGLNIAGTQASKLMDKFGGKAESIEKGIANLGSKKVPITGETLEQVGQKALPTLLAKAASATGQLPEYTTEVEDIVKAKLNSSPQFQAKLEESLDFIYNTDYRDMDKNEFFAAIRDKSGNFDSTNPITAKILFPDNLEAQQNYVRDYEKMVQIASYDNKKAGGIGGTVADKFGQNKELNKLRSALTDALSSDMSDLTSAKKKASEYVKMLQEGTISLDDLRNYLSTKHLKTLGQVGIA